MAMNLFPSTWAGFDPHELEILLKERVGGPGQYHDRAKNPNTIHLPLGGAACRISVRFKDSKIVEITPGPAFDAAAWEQIGEEYERLSSGGPQKVGREISFSTYRVYGSWRGVRSGMQILPPPRNAPRADVEMADHPFILEFPFRAADLWPVMMYRRARAYRNLTFLLNHLLVGGVSHQLQRSRHFWAWIYRGDGKKVTKRDFRWVQEWYFAKFGKGIAESLSRPAATQLEEIEPEEYYTNVGHDGGELCVPSDLDESICCYFRLSATDRAKFDRAGFWMDMASRQWEMSVSTSFASLVSAVEALTVRGTQHTVFCDKCEGDRSHDVPGATERFRAFFETYAPDSKLGPERNKMYGLRSGILHGGELMQLDEYRALGWNPPYWNESELHEQLWRVTRIAIRNWLKQHATA